MFHKRTISKEEMFVKKKKKIARDPSDRASDEAGSLPQWCPAAAELSTHSTRAAACSSAGADLSPVDWE